MDWHTLGYFWVVSRAKVGIFIPCMLPGVFGDLLRDLRDMRLDDEPFSNREHPTGSGVMADGLVGFGLLKFCAEHGKNRRSISTWFFKVTVLDHLVGSVTEKPPIRVTGWNLQKVTD